ncbi:helix-turn-helix transcriptional regulator [Streptodolium elevatio]|uniref:Helix-turn-helix domain-containing protein n=1 Tax=Streptodolium elevatio TaxID=3157996 RepID=A0ABV3DLD2_9ACTN
MPPDSRPDWVRERTRALGVRIRGARLDADLTQEELAHLAGVTKMTIYRIEYGLTDPSLSVLLEIAHAVRIPLRDLIG